MIVGLDNDGVVFCVGCRVVGLQEFYLLDYREVWVMVCYCWGGLWDYKVVEVVIDGVFVWGRILGVYGMGGGIEWEVKKRDGVCVGLFMWKDMGEGRRV